MKFRIQFTPALGGALICTLLWFVLWIAAFRPANVRKTLCFAQTNASLQLADARDIPSFNAPTLFALPSRQGFSGAFPLDHVTLALQFDSPEQPPVYLSPESIRDGDPNPAPLFETVAFPRTEEHFPGTSEIQPIVQSKRIELFFSPELQNRLTNPPDINPPGELPATARVRLNVRPDGVVENTFFDTPVQNQKLIAAIMSLRFAPAPEHTTGWLELRCNGGTS